MMCFGVPLFNYLPHTKYLYYASSSKEPFRHYLQMHEPYEVFLDTLVQDNWPIFFKGSVEKLHGLG